MHSEVTFTIRGEYTQAVYVDPDEISFNQVSATDPVYQEARIFCNLPKQKIEIKGHELSDPSLQKFFRVDCSPLGIDDLRRKEGATSGVLVRVTVKPGLPLGRFQERILLSTNLEKYSQVELPVFGSVGEITLVGAGWSSETGILGPRLGRSPKGNRTGTHRPARGKDAKDMTLKVAGVEPNFSKAKLGKTTIYDGGQLTKTGQAPWSATGELARNSRALLSSSAKAKCPSQSSFFLHFAIWMSLSMAPLTPLAMSAAWAAIREAITPSRTSCTSGRRRCSLGVT